MSNLEFLDYQQFPQDPYTNAIVEICIDGKHIVTYGQKKMKDGGMFWGPASISVTDGTKKIHFKGYQVDSQRDHDQIVRFIEQNVKNRTLPRKGESLQYPHGLVSSQTGQVPSSMSEVNQNDQLPF